MISPVSYIISNRDIKQNRLLRDNPNLTSQPTNVEVAKVSLIQENVAFKDIVKPFYERDDSALPTPTRPNQCYSLSGFNRDGEVLEDRYIRT